MDNSTLTVGNHAHLTVPTRDSAGFSKSGIGKLTVEVVIVALDGRRATVRPVAGGERTATVERTRLVAVPATATA